MPRIPVIVQQNNFGTQNAGAAPTGRSVPIASVKMPAGAAQARQRFATVKGIDPTLARMLDQLQSDIAKSTRLVKAVPFLDGEYIAGLSFGANTLIGPVPHGLGRLWRGYIPCNVQGNGAAFYAIPQGPNGAIGGNDSRSIALTNVMSTAGTFDLWVY